MTQHLNLHMMNPEQLAATTHIGGPLLILAGAGSGKTRVITHRIGYLIAQGIAPEHILAVSFTNKAASEMVERVSGLIGTEAASKVYLSTFHSLGYDVLRQDIEALGYKKPFTILDDSDQLALIKEICESEGLDTKIVDPKSIQFLISRAKMALTPPAALKEFRYDPMVGFAQKVYNHYLGALKGRNAVDFDDLICLPVQLFESQEAIRLKYAQRFQYVMIDEYQDTNQTQLRFLRAMIKEHGNLCVVGDDDQSIYGFRGAVADNILKFEQQFPGTKLITLEQNYRSTNVILEAANAVIAHNTVRKSKSLWSAKAQGESIRWIESASERDESEFVAAEIERLALDLGWRYRDFAILYRSNSQARIFEEALRALGIPYEVVGGQEFYDRREVKDFVAYLKVCFNPSDENNIRRIVNVPPRGIGPVLLKRLSDFAQNHGLGFHHALHEVAAQPELVEGMRQGTATQLAQFLGTLEDYHQKFQALNQPGSEGSMVEAARALMKRLHFEDHLRSQEKSPKIARRRIENLESLLSDISAFSERHGGDLEKYLTRLMLDRSPQTQEEEVPNKVRLMTLHSSKGLEFPCVFMVGMEEGYLPHENSMDTERDLSEERRLAYVGITRAKDLLYLTSTHTRTKYGRELTREPSRFLLEIPEELIAKERAEQTKSLAAHQETRNQRYLELAKKMFNF